MFVKGKSGNPNGRPRKGQTMTDVLRAKIEQDIDLGNGEKVKVKEMIAQKLLELANAGESWAVKYLYDRIDGSPKQVTEVELTQRPVIFPDGFVADETESETD